jgi:hypothetical protein
MIRTESQFTALNVAQLQLDFLPGLPCDKIGCHTLKLQTKGQTMLEGEECNLIKSFMTHRPHASMKTIIFKYSKYNLNKIVAKTCLVYK